MNMTKILNFPLRAMETFLIAPGVKKKLLTPSFCEFDKILLTHYLKVFKLNDFLTPLHSQYYVYFCNLAMNSSQFFYLNIIGNGRFLDHHMTRGLEFFSKNRWELSRVLGIYIHKWRLIHKTVFWTPVENGQGLISLALSYLMASQ